MNTVQVERITHYEKRCERVKSVEEAARICEDATNDPQLFVFSELLHNPSLTQLLSTQTGASVYKDMLAVFAHGTIRDYTKNAQLCKHELNESQRHKLRMLSLVTAAEGCSRLSYDDLRQQLMLSDDAAVEQIIRDAIAISLVRARMDQRQRVVEVSMAVGRDVHHRKVEHMAVTLDNWLKRTESLVNTLDDRIHFIGVETKRAAIHSQQAAAKAAAARKHLTMGSGRSLNSAGTGKIGNQGMMEISLGDVIAMDMDDDIMALQGRNNSNIHNNATDSLTGGLNARRRASRQSTKSRYDV